MPINISGLSEYPDFFAFAITLLITSKNYFYFKALIVKLFSIEAILIIGVRESSTMNNIFTSVNLCVVLFVLICGSIKISFQNWDIKPEEVRYII